MRLPLASAVVLALALASAARANLAETLAPGPMDIRQAGTLAFGPDGVLFIGDTRQGAIYAVATGDTTGDASKAKVEVKGINQQIAAMLGASAGDILINDVKVNPASGNVYISVSRGRGPDAAPVVVCVDHAGKLSEFKLTDARFAKAALNNIADAANQRSQSITGLAYLDGKVIVAGLSNEEFASKLRVLDFPFKSIDRGTGVEMYHGSHGRLETRSPVRTFLTMDVGGKSTVLAAYTCTPLVTFPIADLQDGQKVRGKTVAELGAGNTPLDIIEYKKDGKDFLLVTNTKHGVLKVSTDGIAEIAPITAHVSGTAGLKAQHIEDLKNVTQMDKLNDQSAVILVSANGSADLFTVPLP
jgi:hypothetical protein